MDLLYVDDSGRLRNSKGQFARTHGLRAPDEVCSNGCMRYGDWWVPEDCPAHLGGN